MKKWMLLLLVFVLAACQTAPAAPPVSTDAPAPAATATPQPTPTQIPPPLGQPLYRQVTLWPVVRQVSSASPAYNASLQIPRLAGSADLRVTQFNQRMETLLQGELDGFAKNLNGWTPPPDFPPSGFIQTYSQVSAPGRVLSLKISLSYYAAGAAHPGNYTITINYDLETGQELRLDQIFRHDAEPLQIIADYCKAELSKRDIGFDMFADGANPSPANYRNWNITPDGLMITFDEYQVAAYAAGPQTVTVPYSVLEKIILRDGALAGYDFSTGAPAGKLPPKEILAYLSQNVGSAGFGGQVFSAFQVLGSDASHLYVWALSQEYYPKDGMLEMGSGVSVPVVLKLELVDGQEKIVGFVLPVDGEGYGASIKVSFPQKTWRLSSPKAQKRLTLLTR